MRFTKIYTFKCINPVTLKGFVNFYPFVIKPPTISKMNTHTTIKKINFLATIYYALEIDLCSKVE